MRISGTREVIQLKLCMRSIAVGFLMLTLCLSEVSSLLSREAVIYKCCSNGEISDNESLIKNSSEFESFSISLNAVSKSEGVLRKNITVNATQCHPHEDKLTDAVSFSPNSPDKEFYENGFFRHLNDYFSPQEFCVETSDNDSVTIKIQPKESCNDEDTCLKKCCNPMEVYDLSTYGKSKILCAPTLQNPWDPVVYSSESGGLNKKLGSETSIRFTSDHPRNWCKENVVIWSMRTMGNDKKTFFRILENGTVLKREGFSWKRLNTSRICVDGAINFPSGKEGHETRRDSFSEHELDTIVLECGPALSVDTNNHPTVLYGAALAISSLFLLATMIIYGLLWDKQNVHGLTLLGYVTTMFLFYISLITTYFYLYDYPDGDFTNEYEVITSFCGVIAVISHFLYISTTCWLTVISFDIFAKFRILKLTRTRSKNMVKFVVYLLFALVVPTIIVVTGLVLDILYGDDPEINIIIPRYGWSKCFIDLQSAALPYLFGPIGFLLILNCILYIATIFYMYKLQESTKFARAGASNTHIQKQRAKIRLFSKLFLLMGISWVLEFLSFVAFGTDANMLVIVADLINILQPIAVFIIFVCKRDILESLCQKYSTLTKIFSSFEIEEFTPSTSSNGVPSGKLSKIWNPVASTKWFRSRINSTMTDTSNVSNQSIRSALNAVIEETPLPPATPELTPTSPLKRATNSKEV